MATTLDGQDHSTAESIKRTVKHPDFWIIGAVLVVLAVVIGLALAQAPGSTPLFSDHESLQDARANADVFTTAVGNREYGATLADRVEHARANYLSGYVGNNGVGYITGTSIKGNQVTVTETLHGRIYRFTIDATPGRLITHGPVTIIGTQQ